MKAWLDTLDFDDALARSREFDAQLRDQVAPQKGLHRRSNAAPVFWSDRIRAFVADGDDEAALAVAIEHLPLPGAFAAAAAIWRARIRTLRRTKGEWMSALLSLYRLAALESLALPYSESARQPGFNVMQVIPGSVVRALHVDYQTLGYKGLALLGASDAMWLVEAFGEPRAHSTVNRIHHDVWAEYERKLVDCTWRPNSKR